MLSFAVNAVYSFQPINKSNGIRALFCGGLYISIMFFFMNIGMSVFARFSSASLLRDSDKLIWLWKSRYLGTLNVTFVFIGFIGLAMSVLAATRNIYYGDNCMENHSLSYMHYWDLWWYAEDPMNSEDTPWLQYVKNNTIDKSEAEYDDENNIMKLYFEVMKDEFGLAGTQCYGDSGHSSWIFFFLIPPVFVIAVPFMIYLTVVRNVTFYWLKGWDKKDPFDLTVAYEEYEHRAKIGKELAAIDDDGDGW